MSELTETRRRKLIDFVKGFLYDWQAAEQLGIEPGYLSQLKMDPNDDKNTGRNIGEKIARKMEITATLTHLWFDDIDTQLYKLSKKEITIIRKSRAVARKVRKEKMLANE